MHEKYHYQVFSQRGINGTNSELFWHASARVLNHMLQLAPSVFDHGRKWHMNVRDYPEDHIRRALIELGTEQDLFVDATVMPAKERSDEA